MYEIIKRRNDQYKRFFPSIFNQVETCHITSEVYVEAVSVWVTYMDQLVIVRLISVPLTSRSGCEALSGKLIQ